MLLQAGTLSAEIKDNGNALVDDARAAKRSRVEEEPPSDSAATPAAAHDTPYRDVASAAGGSSTQAELQQPETREVELSPESLVLNARLAETMTRTDELLTLHAKQHQDTIRCRWQLEQAQRQERAAMSTSTH